MKNQITDVENIYKKTLVHYIPGVLIPALSNIFLSLGLARILDVSIYGSYTYYLGIGTIFISLLSQWLVQSIQKYHQNQKANKHYFSLINTICSLLFISFILLVLVWLSILIIFPFNGIVFVIFLFSISQSLVAIKIAIYSAEYKANLVKKINILQACFKLIFIGIYLFVWDEYNVAFILFILSMANIFSFLIDVYRNKEENKFVSDLFYCRKHIKINDEILITLLRYGIPMTGWFIGTNLMGVGDRIILNLYMDVDQVGIYSANYTLVSTGIGLLVSPLLQSAHPIIMNYGSENINNKKVVSLFIEKLSRNFLTVSLFIIIGLFFFYEKVSILFYGDKYVDGAIVIPIITLGIFFWNYAMYGHKGLEITNQSMIMLKFVMCSAIFNILLNIILIPYLGITGSAIGTLMSYFLYAILIKIDSKKHINWIINLKHILIYTVLFLIIFYISSPIIDRFLDLLIDIVN